jgi:DNA-binding protein H-NS
MDLSSLSLIELRDLQQQIPAELKRREIVEKANVLSEMRALAKARGFSIEDFLGKEVKDKVSTGVKVRVKYRHPQNMELEWTGRGRKPKWVEAWLAAGSSLDALLV